MINNDPIWIDIDCVGETTKERYYGRFQIKKYLTNKEKADVYRTANTISVGIQNVSEIGFLHNLAFLEKHVISSDASWWKTKDGETPGLDLLDEKPIYELSNKIYEVQNPVKEEEKNV